MIDPTAPVGNDTVFKHETFTANQVVGLGTVNNGTLASGSITYVQTWNSSELGSNIENAIVIVTNKKGLAVSDSSHTIGFGSASPDTVTEI